MKLRNLFISIICLMLLFVSGCQMKNDSNDTKKVENETSKKSPDYSYKVIIRMVGDILLHDGLYISNKQADGSYQFDEMFEAVKPYLSNADITTANMETIVAGHKLGVSTYPLFNTPEEIVASLKDAGVDIVSNASNHSLDYGLKGLLSSIETLKDYEMMYIGSFESQKDYETPRIIEKNGLKIGFLAYSYGTNGLPFPPEAPYCLSLIDPESMTEEISELKKQVDATFTIIENGEDQPLPTENQFAMNQVAIDAGSNFVLGGHPHVLQPFFRENESQAGLYSHANFISGQIKLDEKIGGISEITFEKNSQGKVIVSNIRFMPTYNLGPTEGSPYKVVPLADWEKYGILNGQWLYDKTEVHMQSLTEDVSVVPYLD